MKKKIGMVTGYAFCIAILVWIMVSTIEVWVKQKTPDPIYSNANCYNMFTESTKEMKVVGCEVVPEDDCFEVVVEDIRGDQYAYYDSEYQYNGTIMEITFRANEIVDAKVQN